MSQTYIFKFWGNLNTELSTQEITTIKFLLGEGPNKPKIFPNHSFFSNSSEIYPLKLSYENFPKGSYAFDFWAEKDNSKKLIKYAINLCIPSLKLEEIYEYYLPMVTWLAAQSISSGYVGSFSLEEEEDFEPMLLFIYKNSIYLGNENSACSFTSGKEISFKELF